jgi:prevent-host-death family protein
VAVAELTDNLVSGAATEDGSFGLKYHRFAFHITTVVILRMPEMREIQLRDAKASLSAVVDEAMQGKPAIITRHGKRQVVVVSYEEWERLSTVPTFGRLLMAAPLTTDDLPGRNKSALRRSGL